MYRRSPTPTILEDAVPSDKASNGRRCTKEYAERSDREKYTRVGIKSAGARSTPAGCIRARQRHKHKPQGMRSQNTRTRRRLRLWAEFKSRTGYISILGIMGTFCSSHKYDAHGP